MIGQKIEQPKTKNPSQSKTPSSLLNNDFQIKNVIGRGTFGTVYLAKWQSKNKTVAIKTIPKNPKYKNREVEILSSLNHPSIISLLVHFQKFDQTTKKTTSYLIMEYVPKTLFSLIKFANNNHKKFQIGQIVEFGRKIFQGLAYLEAKGVCHRDIKPSNLLVRSRADLQQETQNFNQNQNGNESVKGKNNDKEEWEIKICDFGSAKLLKKGQKSITYICSRYYRAPELILGCTQYSNKIDIWAAGCVLAQIITLYPLFDGVNNVDQIAKIVKVIGPPSKQDLEAMKVQNFNGQIQKIKFQSLSQKIKKGNSNVPPQLINLLQNLLVYNPNKRLNASQVLKHQIFSKYNQ